MKKESAFPLVVPGEHGYNIGMTLRDYFAAKVMQGLLTCPETTGSISEFSSCAYEYADAMLEARKK